MELVWDLVKTLAISYLLFGIFVVIHRLWYHPLAHVPGPLLGRAFHFYSFWYNIQGGRFYLKVEELHKVYGWLHTPLSLLTR